MTATHPAVDRPDPDWWSDEAVRDCADAWSVLDGHPSPRAVRNRRRSRIRLWIPLGLLFAVIIVLMVVTLTGDDPFGHGSAWAPAPLITITRLTGLLAGGFAPLVDLAARPPGRSPERSFGLTPARHRRLVRAVRDRAPLPDPWVRVAVAWSNLQGLPAPKLVQCAGWLVWGGSYLLEGINDPGKATLFLLVLTFVAVSPLATLRAARARRYLRWRSARSTD